MELPVHERLAKALNNPISYTNNENSSSMQLLRNALTCDGKISPVKSWSDVFWKLLLNERLYDSMSVAVELLCTDFADDIQGRLSGLQFICQYYKGMNKPALLVSRLLEQGILKSAADTHKAKIKVTFTQAVISNLDDVVEAMLNAGFDVRGYNLHYVRSPTILRMCLDHGADPTRLYMGETAAQTIERKINAGDFTSVYANQDRENLLACLRILKETQKTSPVTEDKEAGQEQETDPKLLFLRSTEEEFAIEDRDPPRNEGKKVEDPVALILRLEKEGVEPDRSRFTANIFEDLIAAYNGTYAAPVVDDVHYRFGCGTQVKGHTDPPRIEHIPILLLVNLETNQVHVIGTLDDMKAKKPLDHLPSKIEWKFQSTPANQVTESIEAERKWLPELN